ncbi:hypothetical protein NP233_g2888 [Leucocoprinus birnbaumii]|uniref:Uncharacterized protein n=1 Tax=Leucocoprinus birnbaumii TaxID=56174 RepID=A0AAD5VXJ6_9AGAR|nr:hypothetical protein NP233_g2888 [Leucocoprinus birnbaumii]
MLSSERAQAWSRRYQPVENFLFKSRYVHELIECPQIQSHLGQNGGFISYSALSAVLVTCPSKRGSARGSSSGGSNKYYIDPIPEIVFRRLFLHFDRHSRGSLDYSELIGFSRQLDWEIWTWALWKKICVQVEEETKASKSISYTDGPWTGNRQVLGRFIATIRGKFLAELELEHGIKALRLKENEERFTFPTALKVLFASSHQPSPR